MGEKTLIFLNSNYELMLELKMLLITILAFITFICKIYDF